MTSASYDVDDVLEQIEVQAGRRAPYSQVGDWVALAPIPALSRFLYWVLAMHVNVGSGTTHVWPTQDTLADLVGLSRGDKVKPHANNLLAIGAIDSRIVRVDGDRMRIRTIYTVHQSPPNDYPGHGSLADYYQARRAALAG